VTRTALGLLVVLTLGGCGAGAGAPHWADRNAAVSDGPGGALYSWSVSGSQPATVSAENRLPGTTAWRLAGGRGRGPIAAYVSSQDVTPGEPERIYVRAPGARRVSVRIFRMGYYEGRGGREVLSSAPLRVGPQPACTHVSQTGLTECHWHPTLSLTIPRALPSGVYVVRLDTPGGDRRECLFVVRATRPAPLLAQISTATYEAYNAWGGDSLYPGGARRVLATGTSQGVEVSYDRPYDSVSGAGQLFVRDIAMVRFLERYGYPVSYTTNASVDTAPGQMLGARTLLDIGHSEYWSQAAMLGFERARDRGVSLVFLSSDTLAWRVRFQAATGASSEAGAPAHRIVAYKEHVAADPDRVLPTGPFPGLGAGLTGSGYENCITPRAPVSGRAVYHYYDWSPTASLSPAWLFAGTGLRAGQSIPGILGYELDRRSAGAPVGTLVVGGGSAPCQTGGSGLGQSTLYRARSGALVFASGTLGWELGLSPVADAGPGAPRVADPRLVALTRNLLRRALGGSAG